MVIQDTRLVEINTLTAEHVLANSYVGFVF